MRRRQFLSALAATAALPPALDAALARGRQPAEVYALVLGSVQDAGFPQVGCYTARCDAGRALMDAGRGRFVSSLALVEPTAER